MGKYRCISAERGNESKTSRKRFGHYPRKKYFAVKICTSHTHCRDNNVRLELLVGAPAISVRSCPRGHYSAAWVLVLAFSAWSLFQ